METHSTEKDLLSKLKTLSNNDTEFVKKMAIKFIEIGSDSITKLDQSIKEQDYESIYNIAHKMKPMLDMLTLNDAFESSRIIEKLADESGQMETIIHNYEILNKEVNEAIDWLKAHYQI